MIAIVPMTRCIFGLILLTTCAFGAESKPAADKTVRLLCVGNSFSGNATHYLGDIAKAAGKTFIHREASIGGSAMQVHWDKAQLHEKDPRDPAGLYTSKKGLREELASEPWDYVTIQQASIKSHDLSTYHPYAENLATYVHQHAPKATLLLHETWEYRRDDPRFSPKNTKPGEPLTQAAMYEQLSNAYHTVAKELHVSLIPTGEAFHLANHDPEWGFVPGGPVEAKAFKAPDVPNQKHSLNMGWYWKKQKDGSSDLTFDGHHANTAGQYLGACVFYEVLFKESVVGNSFVPAGLTPEDAAYLQKTAHAAVEKER
jgi:hypothetical protein